MPIRGQAKHDFAVVHREIHEIRENRRQQFFAYLAYFAVYENETISPAILEERSETNPKSEAPKASHRQTD
jgi:hypothetical protein